MNKGKYLFFDIECANGRDICSFGYCIFDEKLHLVEKRDILINPEKKFVLSNYGKRPKIELSYPQEAFYKQDNFRFFYEDIKKLLVESKYKIFGHSCKSDFAFLNMACDRYRLKRLIFEVFDTQQAYYKLFNRPHIESLESILINLEVDSSFLTFHKSCDDAYASFLVLKEMCFRLDKTLDEMLIENKTFSIINKDDVKKIKKTVDKSI